MSDGLLDRRLIREMLTHNAPWCGSHGADGEDLGAGLLYYSLVYIHAARVAVCLRSGGGFVPRIMRQAQRDLGLQGARTILVDANRPEAGWGSPTWLSPNSFFRTHYSDVECIIATTTQAADRFFAPQGIVIDYLHIDADHSFEACLNDFITYRKFLRPGSVVTLHDTNFPGAGVSYVIEYLNTRPDCEVIGFHGLGAGMALVRIGGYEMTAAKDRRSELSGSSVSPVAVSRKLGAFPPDPPTIGWRYLESEAFSTRSVLAANFVRDCRCVVEIGGGKTPIDMFLTGSHDSVIVLDPFFLRDGRSKTGDRDILHLRARFQDVSWEINERHSYGLVMLGLELHGLSEEDYRTLYGLVENAGVTVIEFPSSWLPSREQFERIQASTATSRALRLQVRSAGQ